MISAPKAFCSPASDRSFLVTKVQGPIFKLSDSDIIAKYGLDAYLFLRYLKTLLRIFFPLALVIVPVLIPINLLDGRGRRGGVGGLDQLSWTNISPEHTNRYWAHLVLAVVVVLWVCHVFQIELRKFIRLRQEHLISPEHSGGPSGTTNLVTDIPKELLTIGALEALYSAYPGGVQSVFINRDFTTLARKVRTRDRLVLMLEAAETRLIQNAQSSHRKRQKEAAKRKGFAEANTGFNGTEFKAGPGDPVWKKYLTRADRETLRLPNFRVAWFPSLPFLGKQVDTIDYCRRELNILIEEIQRDQQHPEMFKPLNSAFIRFKRPIGAHIARQSVLHPQPYTMMPRQAEGSPRHIIWRNVSMAWWQRYLRALVAASLCVALIISCIIPVALTGLLSQLSYLATLLSWLNWLHKLPQWLLALMQGVLPQCLLATVMIIVPLLLHRIIKKQGIHTHVAAELFMQDYYFVFLFIQVFLVVSTSSGITAVLSGATQDFKSLAALVAQNLPKASNYFFSYMLLQALSTSAAALLQVDRLVLRFLVAPLMDNTARQKWNRERQPEMRWGTFFPIYTNFAVIGMRQLFCFLL